MKHIKLFEDWTKDYSDAIKKAYAEYAIVSIISDYKYKQKGQKPVTWKRGTEMLASLGTGPHGGINIRSVKEGGFEVTPAEFKKHWTIVDKISKDEFWKLVKKLPSGFDDPVLPSGFRINEISTQVPAKMVGMDILGDDEEDEEMAGPMGTVGYLGIDESNENASYKKLVSFIKSIKTYMDIYDENDDDEILLTTRDNGNVGNETVGREDIEEARRVRKLIAKKFPDLKIDIEEVDEWVHLNIRKPEEPKFEYIFIKRDDDGAGFSEGFDSMKDLIKKYKTWIDGLNWKKITKEVEAINQFPNKKFNGWLRSNDMLISKEGSKGNTWGYSFYIAKEKSKV